MKRRMWFGAGVLLLSAVLAVPAAAQSGPPPVDRYLDQAGAGGKEIRIAAFNPVVYNIRCLAELRRQGLLDVPGLTVVGIYHVRQTGDFAESRRYVKEHGLDWFKFHVVTAEVTEDGLFRDNALRREIAAIVNGTDGAVFFGGPDIPPSIYGVKTGLMTEIDDPFRHYLEVSAVFHMLGGSQNQALKPLLAARPNFPVLGICLGFQTINVGTGGTLVQDIWSEIYGCRTVEEAIALGPEQWHNNPYVKLNSLDNKSHYNFHSLELKPDSLFCRQLGYRTSDHPRILSSHHQAVGRLGSGLKVMAVSRDGRIIESVGHTAFPNVLGVQFHPEHYLLWDDQPQFRIKPGEPLTSYKTILDSAPPSLKFNQDIWRWLSGRIREFHSGR